MVFGAMFWLLIYDQRLSAVDREIRTLGSRHPGLLAGRGSYERLASSLEYTFGDDYTNHVILLIQDDSGRITYRSPHWPRKIDPIALGFPTITNVAAQSNVLVTNNLTSEHSGAGRAGFGRGFGQGRGGGPPPEVLFTKPARFFTTRTGLDAWRCGIMGNDNVTLLIGLNQSEVEAELNQLREYFFLTLPLALFMVGLGGWLVAGRALRPLKMIADTAERMTVRGLDQRIPQTAESPETARLIQVLNRMMDRLEASFQQATRFSADASHELKTPLAIMQGELENAVQFAAPGSAEQALFSNLLEETQRLKTITRSLLLLAQADAGQLKLARETVGLDAELENVLEDAKVLSVDQGLKIEMEIAPGVSVEADRALLHTAIFNLISNAVKYNRPGGRILVTLEKSADQIWFAVGNTGAAISDAEQGRIFERFYRARRTGVAKDGIGLGLSLAREIVRAHGGELSLKESREDWTCFLLVLPAGIAQLPK